MSRLSATKQFASHIIANELVGHSCVGLGVWGSGGRIGRVLKEYKAGDLLCVVSAIMGGRCVLVSIDFSYFLVFSSEEVAGSSQPWHGAVGVSMLAPVLNGRARLIRRWKEFKSGVDGFSACASVEDCGAGGGHVTCVGGGGGRTETRGHVTHGGAGKTSHVTHGGTENKGLATYREVGNRGHVRGWA